MDQVRNKFRYLQGYMGTGLILLVFSRCYQFRYLQGYMGTYPGSDLYNQAGLFRYLQGYMGTFYSVHQGHRITPV